MKVFMLFGLTFLRMYSCFIPYLQPEYELDLQETIENYPWIVMIAEKSTSEIIAFGSLFHPGAVLTYAFIDDKKQSYFDHQVSAKCSFKTNKQHTTPYHCSHIKNIKEYHVIEDISYESENYNENLVVLILSKLFQLIKGINIIHLAKNPDDFDPERCFILYLMSLPHSDFSDQIRFTAPITIQYEGNFLQSGLNWDDIENRFIKSNETMRLDGNPIVCSSINTASDWVFKFLTHIKSNRDLSTDQLSSHSTTIDISHYHKLGIFVKILKDSGFFEKKHSLTINPIITLLL